MYSENDSRLNEMGFIDKMIINVSHLSEKYFRNGDKV